MADYYVTAPYHGEDESLCYLMSRKSPNADWEIVKTYTSRRYGPDYHRWAKNTAEALTKAEAFQKRQKYLAAKMMNQKGPVCNACGDEHGPFSLLSILKAKKEGTPLLCVACEGKEARQ